MTFLNLPETSMPCPVCGKGTMYPTGYADLAGSHLIGWKCEFCENEEITAQPLVTAGNQASQ